ncbi:hypothetical protein [Actinocrispum wychmicini]|uniref:Sugar lactone lactonase YvrE n=1 Tax=Actinocrispum wychmicini TaxID=1213861 RepID=A0A4R2JBY6_9PSEU|nr:hypothetical protein [Actinocrispum wychmicini]TCO55917.1 hypothetical protein EV192_107340 [Actinocrispum wychmicini]
MRTTMGRLATATLLSAALGAAAPAAADAGSAGPDFGHRPPGLIEVHAPALLPESVGYDSISNQFIVGSVRNGTVSTVRTDGSIQTLVDDPQLVSTAGVRVDELRRRVLVTNLDLGVGVHSSPDTVFRLSGLGSYGIDDGATNWYVDLAAVAHDGGLHFANEIAIAPDGTAYVTDGAAPIIYRVGVTGHADVLVRDDRLAGNGSLPGTPPNFGLTAVAWAPGNLLVVTKADGTVWRVPVGAPAALSQVALSGGLLTFVDDVRTLPDGSLAAISNGFGGPTGAVQTISPYNGWRKATVTSTIVLNEVLPTGITAGPSGTTYVLFGHIADFGAGHPSDTFTLRKVQINTD